MALSSARVAATSLAAIGLAWIGSGLYIPAKAALAQLLLERAWLSARQGGDAPPPWPWADTRPVARLHAPRQRERRIVLAGISGRTLAFGPGLMDGSAVPGAPGNAIIAGHRDTHFRFLRELAPGDPLLIERPDGRRDAFRVARIEVVDSRQARLPLDAPAAQLVLVTCFPFDAVDPGGPLRYVVTADRMPAQFPAVADPRRQSGTLR